MSMYGPESLNEAIRVKGQEYDRLIMTRDVQGNKVAAATVDGQKYASNSTGKGGVLDSVAQNHIKDLDLEKEKAILESEDIIKEYQLYLNGEIEKAEKQYGDESTSQIEKRMVEEIQYLRTFGIDEQKIKAMAIEEYYGGKNLPDSMSDAEKSKAIKSILKLRINYVNKITSLLSRMLQTNYKVLGLSEKQAQEYISALSSGKNDATKAAADVLQLIKNNGDKFLTNNGQSVDLTSLGFGVILGPSKGYELGFMGTDFTNKDAMLNLIQSAMRYDVVVVAHGEDAQTLDDKESKRVINDLKQADSNIHDKHDQTLREFEKVDKDERQDINAITSVAKAVYPANILSIDGLVDFIEDYLESNIKTDKDNTSTLENLIEKTTDKFYDENYIFDQVKQMYISQYGPDIVKEIDVTIKKYKKLIVDMTKFIFAETVVRVIQKVLVEGLDGDIKNFWGCQPTKTLKAGPFDDVNELVRQLIKEGYKKIFIKDCNPGGHKLADDIMNTKGILINYSDFSNYVESFEDNDPNLKIINEAELSLKEFADSYGIDYNDDEYLAECCNWYLENRELIQEGKFDGLKEFFKKILSGIIGFFKRIFDLVKKAFHKLKSLFTGTKDEPKDTKSNFQKPITTKMISVKDKKVVEVTSNNRQELEKAASEMCSTIASEIKKFNQTQQTSMKKIEQDIEKLDSKVASVPKEAASIFENFEMLFEGDLLDAITMIQEFDAGDGSTDNEDNEDEEFSMDDEGGDTPPVEEAPEDDEPQEEDEQEEFSMDEDEGEEAPAPAAETPENTPNTNQPQEPTTPDQPPTEGGEEAPEGDEDENFEIPEEGEDGEGGEEAPEGDEDEEFSMDGDTEGGEEAPDTGTDDGRETTQEELPESKLRDLEAVVFDDLSEDQKKMKIKELKELYIIIYKKCGSISGMISDIKRDQETVQIIEYISNTLVDLKHYIDDYINDIFDSKTYVENLAQLQKYIMIFNAINKVFEQIKQENA